MVNEKKTFREAYGVLQGHAETLRNQTEPNIDDLLAIVEESVSAYRVCKERIDAVEQALEKALNNASAAYAARIAEVIEAEGPNNVELIVWIALFEAARLSLEHKTALQFC